MLKARILSPLHALLSRKVRRRKTSRRRASTLFLLKASLRKRTEKSHLSSMMARFIGLTPQGTPRPHHAIRQKRVFRTTPRPERFIAAHDAMRAPRRGGFGRPRHEGARDVTRHDQPSKRGSLSPIIKRSRFFVRQGDAPPQMARNMTSETPSERHLAGGGTQLAQEAFPRGGGGAPREATHQGRISRHDMRQNFFAAVRRHEVADFWTERGGAAMSPSRVETFEGHPRHHVNVDPDPTRSLRAAFFRRAQKTSSKRGQKPLGGDPTHRDLRKNFSQSGAPMPQRDDSPRGLILTNEKPMSDMRMNIAHSRILMGGGKAPLFVTSARDPSMIAAQKRGRTDEMRRLKVDTMLPSRLSRQSDAMGFVTGGALLAQHHIMSTRPQSRSDSSITNVGRPGRATHVPRDMKGFSYAEPVREGGVARQTNRPQTGTASVLRSTRHARAVMSTRFMGASRHDDLTMQRQIGPFTALLRSPNRDRDDDMTSWLDLLQHATPFTPRIARQPSGMLSDMEGRRDPYAAHPMTMPARNATHHEVTDAPEFLASSLFPETLLAGQANVGLM